MSLEKVEALMEETQEALEYQKEVDQILSRSLTPEEDAAAELEYEQLQKEWAAEDLAHIGRPAASQPLPASQQPVAAPASAPLTVDADIDVELAELENELPHVSAKPVPLASAYFTITPHIDALPKCSSPLKPNHNK